MMMLFINLAISTLAQVNIKVGYGISFPQLSTVNQILADWQPAGANISEPFGSLSVVHGIQLGVRYRLANTGIELGWETMAQDKSALAFVPSSDAFIDRTYRFALNSYHVGIEHYFDKYGIGTALHSQRLGIERPIGNNDLSLVSERQLAIRLQLIWQVQKSDLVSVLIKPYYQIPLGSYDLSAFADDIGVSDFREDSLSMFGVSLVFYNGRQYR